MGNNRLEVKITSHNPDLIYFFTDTDGALIKRRQLSKLYIGGFIDADDPDCQLYYSIRENVIEKVRIVVSLDSPELKQKLCLTLQLSHGLGLALTSDLPFSKIWKQPPDEMLDGENVFTERNVSKITEVYRVFSYIHMCPDIKPGMKARRYKADIVGKFNLRRRIKTSSLICVQELYKNSNHATVAAHWKKEKGLLPSLPNHSTPSPQPKAHRVLD